MPNRTQLYRTIMDLYPMYLREFPQSKMVEILYARYGVADVRLMTVRQLDDLIRHLQSVLPRLKEFA